jgi:serine-type D-Ala-D-Ala carboxypeptidase (penicillin-binding protein 5/6)
MSLDVLVPVERRRRRRRPYRLRLLTLVVLVAAGAGGWFGWRFATSHRHHAAATSSPRTHAVARRITHPVASRSPTPPRLLYGTPLLRGIARPHVLAPAAILVDADTGRVLWAKHPHERRKIASLTKIMTATLALREVPWRSTITVSGSVQHVPLVREGLRGGEHVQAWKIFYSLLLYSGNDDANQLAISSAGSVRAFLVQMNDEARRLGLHDTHYTSPSGVVDRGNYSTPWDLAALTRYALRNPRFSRLVRTKRIQVRWAPPTYSKIYLNNNYLLHEYRGADGVKTGYTHESGWCLVASAKRDGRTLIAVVLDSPNLYADAKTLLNLGFSHG